LNNLAALYARQGRNTEAERLFKQSVATMEKTLGPNHPDLADVLENLAGLYKDQGRYADAREVIKRSMAIRGKTGAI
jgi:tetratricopeptide (TPR) repeat protein